MKMYVNKENLNEEELKKGRVSYRRIIDRYVGDIVLCNNIEQLDDSIFDNAINLYNDENDDDNEIYQYYLWRKNNEKCTNNRK